MLPLTLLFFGQISLISPFVNLLMVPLFCVVLIPVTLVSLLLMVLGFERVSDCLMIALSHCYDWVFTLLEWLSHLPIAQLMLPPMTSFQWLVFAAMVLAYVFDVKGKRVLVVMFITSLFFLNNRHYSADEFDVTLLDVGQGLAMVVEAKDYVLVYDTGPAYASGFNAAEAVLIPYLHYRGISKIDSLIVSHADNDHIGGYPALDQAFEIEEVLTSRVDKLPSARHCIAGQYWRVSNIEFEILSPDPNTPQGSNNKSCVLKVSNSKVSVLISGDIEYQVERYLLSQKLNLKSDIMLIPHQGSKTSSTESFIDAVRPNTALVAAGYRNHYGHPHKTVIERYSQRGVDVLSTIDSGSVLLKINENGWSNQAYRAVEQRFWHWKKKP